MHGPYNATRLCAPSGSACDQLSFSLALSDDPALLLLIEKKDFAGDVVIIEATRSESIEFNFIMCIANFNEVFSVSGEGTVRVCFPMCSATPAPNCWLVVLRALTMLPGVH